MASNLPMCIKETTYSLVFSSAFCLFVRWFVCPTTSVRALKRIWMVAEKMASSCFFAAPCSIFLHVKEIISGCRENSILEYCFIAAPCGIFLYIKENLSGCRENGRCFFGVLLSFCCTLWHISLHEGKSERLPRKWQMIFGCCFLSAAPCSIFLCMKGNLSGCR